MNNWMLIWNLTTCPSCEPLFTNAFIVHTSAIIVRIIVIIVAIKCGADFIKGKRYLDLPRKW